MKTFEVKMTVSVTTRSFDADHALELAQELLDSVFPCATAEISAEEIQTVREHDEN